MKNLFKKLAIILMLVKANKHADGTYYNIKLIKWNPLLYIAIFIYAIACVINAFFKWCNYVYKVAFVY